MEIECDGFMSKMRQVGNGLSEEAWNVRLHDIPKAYAHEG